MDATFKAVAALAIESIPTAIFFVSLIFYLKRMFFQPVARIFEERRKQTEGVREIAEQVRKSADQKTSEFDAAIQLVRNQILQENEQMRRDWTKQQVDAVAAAHAEAEQKIAEAKKRIELEVQQAQGEMSGSIEQLSSRIVDSLTKRRAA